MARHRHDRVTDQPMPRTACASGEPVSFADLLSEAYGRELGREVLDMFMATDYSAERVGFLCDALIRAAGAPRPTCALAGLAAALAPWIERGMGLYK
jgi:hypothetical protein